MDEISKLAYDGSTELLKMKIRKDNSLAVKLDDVKYYLSNSSDIFLCFFFH